MKQIIILLLTTVLSNYTYSEPVAAKLEIEAIMLEQVAAWNRGDIEGFMMPYARGEQLSFISKNGVTTGWQQTLDRYKRRYPDTATMGQLSFEFKDYIQLSDTYAWLMGEYTVTNDQGVFTGHFTLIWEKTDGSWMIIRDHSS